MAVDPATAMHRTVHDGRTYCFCCAGCQAKFLADPVRFLKPAEPAVASVPKAAQAPPSAGDCYTCPMHPQIRRVAPGSCPICGMALEPEGIPQAEGTHPELADMTRRLVIAGVLAAPLFIWEMGAHLGLSNWERVVSVAAARWMQLVVAVPIVLWCAWPFFQRAWASVVNRSPNMFTLIALGVGASFVYSVVATFAPGLFPAGLRQHEGGIPVYFEAAAAVTVLVLLGQVLELRARDKTGGAIRALLKLAPKTARRLRTDGTDEEVSLDQVHVGDRLRVRPGEAVPVDGAVAEGTSAVDESMVTGEPTPVARAVGAKVIGGSINGSGALVITAEKIGADTLLSRIVQMVADAQHTRAPIQRLADSVAAWFVPAVLAAAVLAFAAWMVWAPAPALGLAVVAAVSVLIIACPCALGLATPMSIMVGVGKGAAADRKLALQNITHFASVTGKGVTATVGVRRVVVGNAALLLEQGVLGTEELQARADGLRRQGATAVFVAVDETPAGIIAIADPIKATTMGALDVLRGEGMRIVMLTGDNRTTAQVVAGQLGITEVEADVLPEQKSAIVRRLRSEGRVVAMAGDGVNDAPALAAADVGIAMGTGTDVAIQSAGITLVKGDLAGIARGRALSRATMRNIRQNLVLAFVYNIVGIPVAAGALYPAFGLLLSPVIAAAAMSLSSLSVIGNALRLRFARI
jgi:Cu+-exporting ATPase